jgi:hydroxymethylbilane synthase
MASKFRIGARGSPLSLAQAYRVRARLAASLFVDPNSIEFTPFTTTGDRIRDRPLLEAGGKGLFTKELDEALADRRIDLAVHSAKDLPTRLPDGLALICVPEREDPRDAFIGRGARTIAELPAGATIGSASLRRQAQVLFQRPDLKVTLLRGNVETRLRKIEAGAVDATFLALAGLKRLGLEQHASSIVPLEYMPPAPGQGALAITARADDAETYDALGALNERPAEFALAAERGFLAALDGSCRSAIGAHAVYAGGTVTMFGEVLAPDGGVRFREHGEGAVRDAKAAEIFGAALAQQLRDAAGDRLPRLD